MNNARDIETIREVLNEARFAWRSLANNENDEDASRVDSAIDTFEKLVTEHTAMSDRLRWRKQSEEPAPKDTKGEVLYRFADTIGTCPVALLDNVDEWRPL